MYIYVNIFMFIYIQYIRAPEELISDKALMKGFY